VTMLLISSIKQAHQGPIWIMKFSHDGKFLATAGQDGQILLWDVLPKDADDSWSNNSQAYPDTTDDCLVDTDNRAPSEFRQLLSDSPIQRYEEHNGHHVVDLSWSKYNFLLSASLDKTVRLWHVSKKMSLRVFHHEDYVTSVDFNPNDNEYFLSGGFDQKIRIWSITTREVVAWTQSPDVITAARYSPDGTLAVAGLMKGQVFFYNALDHLKYFTQISCRNRSGSQKDGSKVTGLHFRTVSDEELADDTSSPQVGYSLNRNGGMPERSVHHRSRSVKSKMLVSPLRFIRSKSRILRFRDELLVTTNDSRMRLYGMDDFCLISKFKGLNIPSMQISASFSDCGQYIVCGSEDGHACIWESKTNSDDLFEKKLKNFVAHKRYDRHRCSIKFSASNTSSLAAFVPEMVAKEAIIGGTSDAPLDPISNKLKKHLQDYSSSMVITSDYEGNIKIFARKHCFDTVDCAC